VSAQKKYKDGFVLETNFGNGINGLWGGQIRRQVGLGSIHKIEFSLGAGIDWKGIVSTGVSYVPIAIQRFDFLLSFHYSRHFAGEYIFHDDNENYSFQKVDYINLTHTTRFFDKSRFVALQLTTGWSFPRNAANVIHISGNTNRMAQLANGLDGGFLLSLGVSWLLGTGVLKNK